MSFADQGLPWRLLLVSSVSVFGQSGQVPAASTRRLSVDEAVRLAVAQNLGIRIERLNPEIQDVAIAQTRGAWVPSLLTSLNRTSTSTAPTNPFAGGLNKITDSRFETALGVTQVLPTGGDYSLTWNSSRLSSSNFFQTFNPQYVEPRGRLHPAAAPELQDRQHPAAARDQPQGPRERRHDAPADDHQTVRNVKNAYWDLAFSINNLNAQRQSLDLAKRLLADNEKRVQIGTMAPIDIVEAQSESRGKRNR